MSRRRREGKPMQAAIHDIPKAHPHPGVMPKLSNGGLSQLAIRKVTRRAIVQFSCHRRARYCCIMAAVTSLS